MAEIHVGKIVAAGQLVLVLGLMGCPWDRLDDGKSKYEKIPTEESLMGPDPYGEVDPDEWTTTVVEARECPIGVYCDDDLTNYTKRGGANGSCTISIAGKCPGGKHPGYACRERETEDQWGKHPAVAMEWVGDSGGQPCGLPLSKRPWKEGDGVVYCHAWGSCPETYEPIHLCFKKPAYLPLENWGKNGYCSMFFMSGENREVCYEGRPCGEVGGTGVNDCFYEDACEPGAPSVSDGCLEAIERVEDSYNQILNMPGYPGASCVRSCLTTFTDCMEESNCANSGSCTSTMSSCANKCMM